MKKMLLLYLTCCASCGFAQKSFFGVDAGINVANQRIVTNININGDPGPGLDAVSFLANKVQPTFGVFYHHLLSGVTSVQVNAQYMGLGYNPVGKTGSAVDINYLTFPITFHYHANKHFSLNAGPYVSFTLGGTKINNQDITETYHKNDFGFSFGAEHDLWKNFALGISYVIGLKNIWLNDNSTNSTYTVNSKYTNRALQFTVIYKFKKTN
jgi:hypothetical protein